MELKSKFSKGDTIHFMDNNKPTSGVVTGISAFVGIQTERNGIIIHCTSPEDRWSVDYWVENRVDSVHEKEAYSSRGELASVIFADKIEK